MKTVNKPWGKEEWLELNDKYCTKRIYINQGYRTSYQYHDFKVETNCLISGVAELWLENDLGVVEKTIIKSGDFFNVIPKRKHRITALTDLVLYETSTPEVDDVVRIQDDANRKDGRIETEHLQNCERKILSDPKNIEEVTYRVNDRVFKFSRNADSLKNKFDSSKRLSKILPKNISLDGFLLSYDWVEGQNLYDISSKEIYADFLVFFSDMINKSEKKENLEIIGEFYSEKTKQRKKLFIDKYGENDLNRKFTINGILYPSMSEILSKINLEFVADNSFLYSNFHGDLHFKNIIHNNGNFTLIDWRDSFGSCTDFGDVYYDISKLYSGCLFPFYFFNKKGELILKEENDSVTYRYEIEESLKDFTSSFEKWIHDSGFDMKYVEYLTGLIFFHISTLHEDLFNRIFFFKSIEILSNHAK